MSIESLERLAASQHAVFTASQATSENVTPRQLAYYAEPGRRWVHVGPAVYWVPRLGGGWRRRLMAAQLWAGSDATLSGQSAAAIIDLDGADRRAVELCLPRRKRAPNGWTTRLRQVPPERVWVTEGLRHTDPLTTLTDLAAAPDDDPWEWALESALRRGLVDLAAVEASRLKRIRRVLAKRPSGCEATGSMLETQFVQLSRTVAVAPLVRQYPVWGPDRIEARLDLCWPQLGLFIEIDGAWHLSSGAQDYDRHRSNEVVSLLGWRPLRYRSADIRQRPRYTARKLEEAYLRACSGVWGRPRT